MGGEIQRGNLTHDTGYSAKAQFTGKQPSYLEPNSGSLHVPIEGVYRITEKIEDRVTIGEKTAQNHVENTARTYLERIRNSMRIPIEGLSSRSFSALNKEGGSTFRAAVAVPAARKRKKINQQHTAPKNTRQQPTATEKAQFTTSIGLKSLKPTRRSIMQALLVNSLGRKQLRTPRRRQL
jgi:hypothetical protein